MSNLVTEDGFNHLGVSNIIPEPSPKMQQSPILEFAFFLDNEFAFSNVINPDESRLLIRI